MQDLIDTEEEDKVDTARGGLPLKQAAQRTRRADEGRPDAAMPCAS